MHYSEEVVGCIFLENFSRTNHRGYSPKNPAHLACFNYITPYKESDSKGKVAFANRINAFSEPVAITE